MFQLLSVASCSFTVHLLRKIEFCLLYTLPLHHRQQLGLCRAFSQLNKLISLIFCLCHVLQPPRCLGIICWTHSSVSLSVLYWRAQPGHRTPDVVLEVPAEWKNHFLYPPYYSFT